jgi:energy-coupling factor transporter ATP-binding protein EcfA2
LEITSTDLVLIAGKRGSGKSTLLRGITDTIEPLFQQDKGYGFLKVDPLREMQGIHIDYGDRVAYNKILQQAFQKKNQFIITDEADGFFKNKAGLSTLENRFIHIGRHYGLGGIFVTRRLSNLHTDLVSQANKIFIFKHWQRSDLDYLKESGLGEFIEPIFNLQPYEFLSIDIDSGESAVNEPL